ncbi:MAG: FRG domain-containing protein [Cyclobacteriaceae bacterium]|nr:FRG domain-containing protein [Cyclobacteriaceae bacterium]
MKVICTSSYQELKEAADQLSAKAGNSVFYRGTSSLLVPSIVEKSSFNSYADLVAKEYSLVGDFEKYSHIKSEFKNKIAADWGVRIAAREHGLASSLMDWSNSLDIALEFAIHRFEKKAIDYTNLWILNTSGINRIRISDKMEKQDSFHEIESPSIIDLPKYTNSGYWRRKFIQGGYFLFQSPQEIVMSLDENPLFLERLVHFIIPKTVVPDIWKNIASKVNLDLEACPSFDNSDKALDEKCLELNKLYC